MKKQIELLKAGKNGLSSFLHFMLVSGLLSWIITLFTNAVIFVITLYHNLNSLPYCLGFFAISVVGQVVLRRK
jgi:hypothetical protein